jgi:hypothetical protein
MPIASLALPHSNVPVRLYSCIFFGVLVPTLAMGFNPVESARIECGASHVFLMRNGFKMLWIYARSVSALVIYLPAFRDWPNKRDI